MLAADKPPLNGVYLAHFGVKGMHWGQRKATDSGGQKQGMSTAKKAAIGGALVVGATAAAYVIHHYGGSKIPTMPIRPKLEPLSKVGTPYSLGDAQYFKRIDSGRQAHIRTMNLLHLKKGELENVASLEKIDLLLKKPTTKMPTLDKVLKANRRSQRLSSIKGLFNRPSKPPVQLFPTTGLRRAPDMSQATSNLMRFTDEALRKGG